MNIFIVYILYRCVKMALVVSAGGDHSAYVLGMMHQLFATEPRCDWKFLAGNSAGSLICCGVCKATNEQEYIRMVCRMFESMCNRDAIKEWSIFGSVINLIQSIFYHKSFYRTTLPDMICQEFGETMPPGRSMHTGVYNQTKGRYETKVGYSPQVVAASCSIPGIFEPVVIDGDEYIDGGMVHIIPTPAILEWCESNSGRLDIMCCYPICSFLEFRKTEYMCSRMKLVDEGLETFVCMLWNNLQRDLDELSTYFQVDIRRNHVFDFKDISVRFFVPSKGIYSSFTNRNPIALHRMFIHGRGVVKKMFNNTHEPLKFT